MDSFELNKILGAVLGTCLVLVAVNIAADTIFTSEKPARPGYEIAIPTQPTTEANAERPASPPIELLLASPNGVGPNLWGVVNRPRASEPGYNYSAAMKAKGGEWTFDELNKFLMNPGGAIPGTAMTFAGISRAQERADVIDYLHTLADNPVPLPKAEDAPASVQSNGPTPALTTH